MLCKYPCGCIGLEPDGNEKGPVILFACDSTDDGLPSNLSRVVGYRRHMVGSENRQLLTEIQITEFFGVIGELKSLATVGQEFINLTETSRRIAEQRRTR